MHKTSLLTVLYFKFSVIIKQHRKSTNIFPKCFENKPCIVKVEYADIKFRL